MACEHIQGIAAVDPKTTGCEECMAIGSQWVHLRLCMACGHVGCCDSSPNTHATGHHRATEHPVIQSFEPGEHWVFCYVDEDFVASVRPELRRSYA